KKSSYWTLIGVSTLRVIRSFAFSFVLSILLGTIAGKFLLFRQFLSFPMGIIKATPVISFILLAIFWFKTNSVPVFIGVLMTLPVMTGGVIAGIQHIDKKLDDMCTIYGLNVSEKFFSFYVPSVAPYVVNSSLTSFSLTWKVVVASEVIALPQRSIGFALQTAKVQLETADVFAWTVSIVLVSFLLESLLSFALKHIGVAKISIRLPKKNDTVQPLNMNVQTDISIDNFTMSRGGKSLFNDFSIHFAAHSITAIIAPSGGGKTSLFDCIAGLLKPDSGSIVKQDGAISYLFQEPRLLPSLSVLENIALPLQKLFSSEKAKKRACYYLQKVGLSEKKTALSTELSGGEKQRAALARAFAYPSSVLLMDEAFQSQDIRLKTQLGKLFKSLLTEEPKTVVMVTHDIREAIELAERILVLDGTPLKIQLDEAVVKSNTDNEGNAVQLFTAGWELEKKIATILS
ncbi:MAG TPA: ATP-binding cassette domain-containing protein, partial [Treponemataceae bacterium]|nr:ATP-binding cassette domain-containing protein [Treponemataceae bacterium]